MLREKRTFSPLGPLVLTRRGKGKNQTERDGIRALFEKKFFSPEKQQRGVGLTNMCREKAFGLAKKVGVRGLDQGNKKTNK